LTFRVNQSLAKTAAIVNCRSARPPRLIQIVAPFSSRLSRDIQGTVCKILGQEELKPHKVRFYLECRDAEFEQKMAEVLCVSRCQLG
jgi:hypothetical protein